MPKLSPQQEAVLLLVVKRFRENLDTLPERERTAIGGLSREERDEIVSVYVFERGPYVPGVERLTRTRPRASARSLVGAPFSLLRFAKDWTGEPSTWAFIPTADGLAVADRILARKKEA